MELDHGIFIMNLLEMLIYIHKNNFLVLGEGPANDINDCVSKA